MADWWRVRSRDPRLSGWEESLWGGNLRPDTVYRYLHATSDLVAFAEQRGEPGDWPHLVELIPNYLDNLAALGRASSTIERRAQRLGRFGRWVDAGADSDGGRWPRFAVVGSDDVEVGAEELRVVPGNGSHAEPPDAGSRGEEVRSAPPVGSTPPEDEPPPEAPQSRFLEGQAPTHVRPEVEFEVMVRIARTASDAAIALKPISIPKAGVDMKVVIHAPSFEVLGDGGRVVHVPRDADSDWAVFQLRARAEGPQTVEVHALIGATFLGTLALEVAVDQAAQQTGPLRSVNASIQDRVREPGEVTIIVEREGPIDTPTYRFIFIDDTVSLPGSIRSEQLLQPPRVAIEALMLELNARAAGHTSGLTPEQSTTLLRGQAIQLWQEFIPAALRALFWERHDRITRISIVAVDDPIPWELLYPADEGQPDIGFLAERYQVVRWLSTKIGPAASLPCADGRLIVPTNAPTSAGAEAAGIRAITPARATWTTVSDLDGLLALISSGSFDLMHFACHNAFGPGDSAFVLINGAQFRLAFLSAAAAQRTYGKRHPIVFMNGCRTGGEAAMYTQIAGWAQRFVEAGAGAFIGTLWSVRDTAAKTFAESFYQALFDGESLGTATTRARTATKDTTGDPTWLAYVVYGDPAATLA